MTTRGKQVLVLAVAVAAAATAATAWFFRGRPGDIDVTKMPGAMKRVGTFTTEAVPFYSGDIWFLQFLARGRTIRTAPVRDERGKAGMPPLVSPRAASASFVDADLPAHSASFTFFIDESGGKGSGYDRLYADRNGDGWFDAEESVGLLADAPAGAALPLLSSSGRRYLVFEPFDLEVGPDKSPRHVVARLGLAADGSCEALFVGEDLRLAKVTFGGVECSVFLQSRFPGDFDGPMARRIIQYAPERISEHWGGSLWSINGSIYRLSVAPRGETVTVEEYVADAGTIVVGTDGAWKGVTVEEISVGCGANLFVTAAGPLLEEKGEFRVPAGRYYPAQVSLTKGAAATTLRDSSPSVEGHDRPVRVSRDGRSRLDLAAKPEVTFTLPSSGARVRQGGMVQVEALMKCPDWQLIVAGISAHPDAADGKTPGKTIQPQVVVKDSAGKVVAEGPMPFG
jgi:hypothetical protein